MAIHWLTIQGWHPARLNELMQDHWRDAARRKRQDRQMVALAARMQQIPAAQGKRRVSLVLTLAPRQRAGDVDCYWKSLLDALVQAGLLLDDNRQYLELGGVTFNRGDVAATTIVLEDLAGV